MMLHDNTTKLVTVVKDALPDIQVLEEFPDRFSAPLVIVTPAQVGDWITAQPMNNWTINQDINVVVERGSWEIAMKQLKDILENTLVAVRTTPTKYGIAGVTSPGSFKINNTEYLACIVRCNSLTKLEGSA